MPTCRLFLPSILGCVCSFASISHAQLTFTELQSNARVEAGSVDSQTFESMLDETELEFITPGPFAGVLIANSAANGGVGSATSNYNITQGEDGFVFISELANQASLGQAFSISTNSSAGISAVFSTVDTMDIALSGAFVLDQELPAGFLGPIVDVRVQLLGGAGMQQDFVNLQYIMSSISGSTDNELRFIDVATLRPDGEYSLLVQATISGNVGIAGSTQPVDLSGRFVFRLDHLDYDGDGLFNTWEEDGIDFEIDGTPELDLPGEGADPQRKDLFVEIDTHNGIQLQQSLLDEIATSFDDAPVPNPNGQSGINLHIGIDETALPNRDYTENLVTGQGDLKMQIRQQRDMFFGTAAQRQSDISDVLIKSKLLTYRYCVVGGSIEYTFTNPNPCPGEDPITTLRPGGMGEIPGDEFIITLQNPNNRPGDMARSIMHELGHCLGLRHGGCDNVNFKPNYFSVMNYMHALEMPNWGQQWNDGLRLDYSRADLPDVDESSLSEPIGIGSNSETTAGRLFAFANDNPINPSGSTRIWIADGSPGAPVDWNIDGSTTAIGIMLDVNRSNIKSPESIEVHSGHDDWANLYYKVRGGENFGFGPVAAGDSTLNPEVGELSFEEAQALNDLDVVYLVGGQPCPADLNDDGQLNFFDVSAFLTAYQASDPAADFNDDGELNFFDVSAFLVAYQAGCG
ncbi:MAG: GC-type dockerin domain-anchored protein [Phycisphaerales bacterium]